MPWTGDVIAEINNFLRERYDMSGIQSPRVYKNVLLDRIEKVADRNSLYAYVGGKGYIVGVQSQMPSNVTIRDEAEDFPLPRKHSFARMTVREVQYAATTGITKEEQDEARTSEAALANLIDIKLRDLRDDLRFRLATAIAGDGSGRLGHTARGTSYNSANELTLANTYHSYGWQGAELIMPDTEVVVLAVKGDGTMAATSGSPESNVSVTAGVRRVTAVNYSENKITLSSAVSLTGTNVSTNNWHFQIFASGAINLNTAQGSDIKNWVANREMFGLWHIVDDGEGKLPVIGGTNPGASLPGNNFFGLNRTEHPTLRSRVISRFNGTNLDTSWTIETILKPIRDIENGFGGGQITALYCHPDMCAAIARRGFMYAAGTTSVPAVVGAVTQVTDNKVTWGHYTRALNVEGRLVPIIPVPQRFPRHAILGVCEDDLMLFMPEPINFVNPYTGETGNRQVFFGSPGARNLTFEAWLRCVIQLAARRCDNSFKIVGLSPDV